MNAKRLTFTALILVALGGFLPGCRKSSEQGPPPLVRSLCLTDYDSAYYDFAFTDSLVCMVKRGRTDGLDPEAYLYRAPIDGDIQFDTFRLIVPENASVAFDYFFQRLGPMITTPNVEKSITFSPLPLGDTSGMLRFGHAIENPRAFVESREMLPPLSDIDLYLVDLHSRLPRTLARLEGHAMPCEYPWLLLLAKGDGNELELTVVDLGKPAQAARIGLGKGKLDEFVQARLTADGKLLYAQTDENHEMRFSFAKTGRTLTSAEFYDSMTARFGVLSFLIEFLELYRSKFLMDLVLQSLVPWRSYTLEKETLKMWNLNTGERATRELFLPSDIMYQETQTFLDPQGRLLFLSPDGGGWGMPTENLPRNFVEVPAICGLEFHPGELSYLRKLVPPGLNTYYWELSPEKRWFVLYLLDKKQRLKEAVVVPIQVLSDSTLMEGEDFRRIPVTEDKTLRFVPGERWVLVQDIYGGRPLLYACGSDEPPRTLAAPDETEVRDVFFSPDGRYVGYVCQIRERSGYFLQVRLLPES